MCVSNAEPLELISSESVIPAECEPYVLGATRRTQSHSDRQARRQKTHSDGGRQHRLTLRPSVKKVKT
jgi:hypothetical protein